MMRSLAILCGVVLCAAGASADSIGFEVNGTCEAGSCPAQPLAFSSNFTLPVASTVTLANGDSFTITGTLTSINDSSGGSVALTYQFQVSNAGSASGGASQADSLKLDVFSAYQSTFSTGNFNEILAGTFSPTVGASSAAQMCFTSVCTSTVNPPGAFNVSAPFVLNSTDGAFAFDYTITAAFGAGSPVGSYIEFNYPVPSAPNVLAAIGASAFGGFSSIAPGDWIEIYGTDLAVGTRTWSSSDFNGVNAPTSLGGTSVTIGGFDAYVDYVSPLQVNVQVPGRTATGTQSLIVTTAAGSSQAFPVTVNATEPGWLAPPNFNIGGTQYVVAQFADGTYVLPPGTVPGGTSRRAVPGDVIVIYGIGFGLVDPSIPPGQLAAEENTLAAPFSVSIGGALTQFTYDGLAPGYVGLYQFNLVVPTLPVSDTTPLTFTLNGRSGTQTLAIAVGN